jgi:hypothetical protein
LYASLKKGGFVAKGSHASFIPRNDINLIAIDNHPKGVYNCCMKRVNYHLTTSQIAKLKRLSQKTELSIAELIRRAVDEYLEKGIK